MVWQFLTEPTKPWVALLRAKYNSPTESNTRLLRPSTSSYIWQSLVKASEFLHDGYQFSLGRGDSHLWKSDWLGIGQLGKHVPYIDIHDLELRVCNIWHNDEWSFGNLWTNLPDWIKQLILDIPGPRFNGNDTLIWQPCTTGTYSASSGYEWLLRRFRHWEPHQRWKRLWKLRCPEKLKLMVWQCFLDILPTNDLRHHCELATTPSCTRCHAPIENIRHCLFECPSSKEIWQQLGMASVVRQPNLDFHQWLDSLLENDSPSLMLAALWWCWRRRNQMILGNEDWHLHWIIHQVWQMCYDMEYTININNYNSPPPPAIWQRPPPNVLKINTDASVSNSGSGWGCVLRNSDGIWIYGSYGQLQTKDVTLSELIAIREGFTLAWSLGWRKVICESDCLAAVGFASNPKHHRSHVLDDVVNSIQRLIQKQWDVSIHHVLRTANRCADLMARMGVSTPQRYVKLAFPTEDLLQLLLDEALA